MLNKGHDGPEEWSNFASDIHMVIPLTCFLLSDPVLSVCSKWFCPLLLIFNVVVVLLVLVVVFVFTISFI